MHATTEVYNIFYYISVVVFMTLINVKFANISARSLLYLSLLLAGISASLALAILSFSMIGFSSAMDFDDFSKAIRVCIGIYTVLVVLSASFADSVASVASFCYVLESVPPGYSSNLPTSLFLIVGVFGINITKIIPFDDTLWEYETILLGGSATLYIVALLVAKYLPVPSFNQSFNIVASIQYTNPVHTDLMMLQDSSSDESTQKEHKKNKPA